MSISDRFDALAQLEYAKANRYGDVGPGVTKALGGVSKYLMIKKMLESGEYAQEFDEDGNLKLKRKAGLDRLVDSGKIRPGETYTEGGREYEPARNEEGDWELKDMTPTPTEQLKYRNQALKDYYAGEYAGKMKKANKYMEKMQYPEERTPMMGRIQGQLNQVSAEGMNYMPVYKPQPIFPKATETKKTMKIRGLRGQQGQQSSEPVNAVKPPQAEPQDSGKRAIEWLTKNNAPITQKNIEAVKQKFGW